MKFTPAPGYIEVEPINSDGVLVSDEKKWVEKAKVVGTKRILFFRPHGFFELAEYEGKKHYVVRDHPDFILGYVDEQ